RSDMELRLYNTLTRSVEPFTPLEPGRVRMYTCGLTAYDYGHIGNFRTFVGVDILQRFLATQGYDVDSVMNITDVDDKMIARSTAAGRSLREYADFYAAAFTEDCQRLRIRPARHIVRATDFIPDMVAWIERLVASGYAYEREGSVYFRLASFPAYGRLSGKDLDGLQSGARVDVDDYAKEEARDFVLWKAWKEGEPFWESPWGKGRPGWHIECSVMAEKLLGTAAHQGTIDIHAGGTDLIFPHHENEIAQVEPLTQAPFVRFWVHMEFLLVNGEKMSKRLGNFYTVRDLMEKGYHPSAIRYLLASVPYRRQLNFTLEGLDQATSALERLRVFQDRIRRAPLPDSPDSTDAGLNQAAAAASAAMVAALAENLNTAEALAAIFDLVRVANTALDAGQFGAGNRAPIQAVLDAFDEIFAVLASDAPPASALSSEAVDQLLAERDAARRIRDYARADALRRQLDDAGVLVEDIKGGGARWRWK
ncbi:MAG TPA: cysteine--tRNA ligase, partial [Terriglobales bacterium]|nr:cysteine--tRNA ligase [Terriglobales bacterium]